jgi:hypothetical protein
MESRLSAGRAPIKTKPRALFDPKVFLAKIGEGRSLADYQKKQKVFSQGVVQDVMSTGSGADWTESFPCVLAGIPNGISAR